MLKQKQTKSNPEQEQSFITHLLELRDRLLVVLLVFLAIFILSFIYWREIYVFLSEMVVTNVKQPDGTFVDNDKWINLSPAGGFFTALKLAMNMALFVSLPFIFFQLWRFIAPGLYQNEQKLAMPLIVGGITLFYIGIMFARWIVLPVFFVFAETFIPPNTKNMYDIMLYLNFAVTTFFAFSIAFQVPILVIVLVWGGVVKPEVLAKQRRYIIVLVFIIAAVLTPPDILSQIMLAIPMLALFELGLFISRLYAKKPTPESDSDSLTGVDSDNGENNISPFDNGAPTPPNSETNLNKITAQGNAISQAKSKTDLEKSRADIRSLYPADYKPLTDAEADAEMERFDREMDALAREQNKDQTTPGAPPTDNSSPSKNDDKK